MKCFKTILFITFISLIFSSCSLHLLASLDNDNNNTENNNNSDDNQNNSNSNNNNSNVPLSIIQLGAVYSSSDDTSGNTTLDDYCVSVAVDGSSIYCAGYTTGALGEINGGAADAFIMKITSGVVQWTTQLGDVTATSLGIDTTGNDYCLSVAVDGDGNVYCAGTTGSSLGEANGGDYDAFVMKVNSSGAVQWIRQLGDVTEASIPGHDTSQADRCNGVFVDGSKNVYCAGQTYGSLGEAFSGWGDAFIMKLNSSGVPQWIRQLGAVTAGSIPGGDTSQEDSCLGVSADPSGAVYCAGYTKGSLGEANGGGKDAFVIKVDGSGNPQWITQLGASTTVPGGNNSGNDICNGVTDDGTNVYCAGYTSGSLGEANGGGTDAFAMKLDGHGNLLWLTQFGAVTSVAGGSNAGNDSCNGVATDGTNVYCAGYTDGNLGELNGGGNDAFAMKLDANGTPQWLTQAGAVSLVPGDDTSQDDTCAGVAVTSGTVYCAGSTTGSLGEANAGFSDIFFMKL